MPSIRVLIADDHQLFRQSLRQVCEAEGGFEVVAEAENGLEAVELARRFEPDVVLMDLQMPVLDGIQATRMIAEENPEVRVIMLTAHRWDEVALEALKMGAWCYLLKDVEEEVLVETVRAVYRNAAPLDAHLTARVLGELRRLTEVGE